MFCLFLGPVCKNDKFSSRLGSNHRKKTVSNKKKSNHRKKTTFANVPISLPRRGVLCKKKSATHGVLWCQKLLKSGFFHAIYRKEKQTEDEG
jgi:hypothetical protein